MAEEKKKTEVKNKAIRKVVSSARKLLFEMPETWDKRISFHKDVRMQRIVFKTNCCNWVDLRKIDAKKALEIAKCKNCKYLYLAE